MVVSTTESVRDAALCAATINAATINDVARLADVSKKTVSRVINNEPNVRPDTREKVQRAMSELNYFPNLSARSLASRRSYLVAMLYFDVGAYYLHQLQSGLLDHFSERNYSLLMQPCEGETAQILTTIEQKTRYMNIDGFVLVPPLVCLTPLISLLKRLGKPYIRITPREEFDGFTDVLCDDEEAAFELTSHLIRQGHSRIAFVRGNPGCLSTVTRFEGYKRALLTAGLPYESRFVADGTYEFASGLNAGQQLLQGANRPTAIFCSNDDMAAGVLHVAHDRGLRVPADLAVAGYDDSPLSRQTWPALTSVKQPNRRMAEIAANKLIDKIAGISPPEYPQNIGCEIIYRASTENI
jgi:LacI family transcriptional regulator